jgi:hypothetical protein
VNDQDEIVALRDRVAHLEAALLVDGAKLLARNARLEAALMEARGWVRAFNSAEVVHQGDMLKQIDAALKDAPQ